MLPRLFIELLPAPAYLASPWKSFQSSHHLLPPYPEIFMSPAKIHLCAPSHRTGGRGLIYFLPVRASFIGPRSSSHHAKHRMHW